MNSPNGLLRLQMLSQLSLPENIFLAAFLTESHSYLPSLSNSYCFLNKKLQPIDFYDERNHQALLNSIKDTHKSWPDIELNSILKADYVATHDKAWRHHPLKKKYLQTFVRTGYHQSLILPVKKSGVCCGLLIFNRDRNDALFNKQSIKQAKLLRNVLEEGLSKTRAEQNKNTSGWRSGLIIVDEHAEMTHCCNEGQNMLALALQRKPGSLQRISFTDIRNLPGVLQMVDKLLDTNATPVSNEVVSVSSIWGEFQINGFPVLDQGGTRAPQVYLNISWQVPFSLLLFHNIENMCFTPRQQVIALLYAAGESTKSIANKLEISLYTVKEHIQHIFEKLRIHTRAELIENIICQNCETSDERLEQGQLHRTERTTMNIGGT